MSDSAGGELLSVELLSVVVPMYCEADIVHELHRQLLEALEPLDVAFEIVFVDDGSTDATLAVVRRLAADDPRVRYVALSRNFGKESAMLAGLRRARGTSVLLMDADLQHPPALIASLLESHRAGFDQVVARRTRSGDPRTRSWFARFYYRAVKRLADVEIIDGVGDFRLLSRRAVDAILSLEETNRFSKGLFAWIGFDTAVVEYDNVPRAGGRSRWSAGRLINYGVQGIVSFNDRPLRAAIYLGSAVTGLAGLYVAYIIVQTVVSGVRTPGYVTLITAMVVMSGLQLLFLGIMGEYVGKIYFEAKRRPHYLVKETEEMVAPSVAAVRRTPSHR